MYWLGRGKNSSTFTESEPSLAIKGKKNCWRVLSHDAVLNKKWDFFHFFPLLVQFWGTGLMYQSNRSFNIPPGHTPGFLTPFLAPEGGNLITTHRGWRIWSLASMSCYEINHGGDGGDVKLWWIQKEKIAYLWRIGWKPKVYTSCVPYLKVFKNDLCL